MSLDIRMSNMGTQWVTFLKEEVQIWNTRRLKMQAAGVSEIENIYIDKVVKMVRDIIFLRLRIELSKPSKFGFIWIVNRRIRPSSKSTSNPNGISEKGIDKV